MPVLWHDDYILSAPAPPPQQQQPPSQEQQPVQSLIADLSLEELRAVGSPEAAKEGRLLRVFKHRDSRAWSTG